MYKTILLFFFVLAFSNSSWSRPEYAARLNINRCTACHFSPSGGGLRNVYGKLFGASGFKINKVLQQDYVGGDLRLLYYNPAKRDTTRDGMAVMAGIVGASIAIDEPGQDTEYRLVYSHDVGGIAGTWDVFLRWRLYAEADYKGIPQYIIVGRFHPAFGVMTDEHRTYTKMQTESMWNLNLETGMQISGDIGSPIHYDLAVLNGESNRGTLDTGRASLWSTVANIRWTSALPLFPLTMGVSQKHYERKKPDNGGWAVSTYAILPFERVTNNHVRGDLIVEYVRAKYLNSTLNGFTTDGTYLTANKDAESEGIFAMFEYRVFTNWVLQYKYDRLLLDKSFPDDPYQRHGFGFKHFIAANTNLIARFEKAKAAHPTEANGTGRGALDAFLLMMQVGL